MRRSNVSTAMNVYDRAANTSEAVGEREDYAEGKEESSS
jgi:hypothetical protein